MISVTRDAARLVLPLFVSGCDSRKKADGSLVTIADTLGEATITKALAEAYPSIALLGEESVAEGAEPDLSGPYFCLDPIDGTKQFAAGDPQWVIALAYLELGRPVAGVICAPALSGRLFAGLADSGGFEMDDAGLRTPFPNDASRETGSPFIVLRGGHDTAASIKPHLPDGVRTELKEVSSALKFGLIGVGEADMFVRTGQVWDWDIAAGQAIVEASGGQLLDMSGQALHYGRAETGYRHPPFVARGRRALSD
jgi:3'(2'),5'-bisphosphate nucleotidase